MTGDEELPFDGSQATPDAELVAAVADAQSTLRDLGTSLDSLHAASLDLATWLEALASLGQAMRRLQAPGKVIGRHFGVTSAKARMLEYLLLHQGEVVSNYSLAGVAGTLEWARRVRELQLEQGWRITSGPDEGLRPGEYRLDADEADDDRAATWKIRNEVRRLDGSGAGRCLIYLHRIFPAAASKDDLQYVARINEWPRRMRELEEQGWAVVSSIDDPSLPAGSYRLETLEQGPPRSRQAIKRRQEILERDGWTCRLCGASPTSSAGTRLQIHHRQHVVSGGTNDEENLLTLCVECHLGVHASELTMTSDELLEPGHDPWQAGRPAEALDDV